MRFFDVLFGRRPPPLVDPHPCDECSDETRDDRIQDAARRTAEIERRLQAIDIERATYRDERDTKS